MDVEKYYCVAKYGGAIFILLSHLNVGAKYDKIE